MDQRKMKFLDSDPTRCLGCKGCELACGSRKASIYQTQNKSVKRTIVPNIIVTQGLDEIIPAYCRHCENAFCEKLCPTKAIAKVEDGVVLLNEEKCTGCGICQQGCPYGVISLSPLIKDGKNKNVANKCDLCRDRQLNEEAPLCYLACPTKALRLI